MQDSAAVGGMCVGGGSTCGMRRRGGGRRMGLVVEAGLVRMAVCACVLASLACVRAMSYQADILKSQRYCDFIQ